MFHDYSIVGKIQTRNTVPDIGEIIAYQYSAEELSPHREQTLVKQEDLTSLISIK